MSVLYVVSTPIGNLKDITLRALEVLADVDLILSEDTRRTGNLLSYHKIKKPLESFFEHNEEQKIGKVINELKAGTKIALVSDAGTPLISDPGYKLIRECVKHNIKVESIPGPSSLLAALTSSGLPTDQFLFVGYLPKKTSKQNSLLDFIESVFSKRPTTVIFFESPFRLKRFLEILKNRFPDKNIVIARELTKVHEEFIRSSVREVSEKNITTKGEVTILLR